MNHLGEAELEVMGPARYCPDCKRWLAGAGENGEISIANDAHVSVVGESIVLADLEPGTVTRVPAHIMEATCDRRRCRLRRWAAARGIRIPRRRRAGSDRP